MASSTEGSQESSEDDYSMLGDSNSDEAVFIKKNGEVDWDAYKEYMNRPEVHHNVFCSIVIHTLLMFTLPFAVMYGLFLFLRDHSGWTSDSAVVPAALIAAFVVYLIVGRFVYVAFKEEKMDAELLENLKKRQ